MRKLVTVRKVDAIRPIPGADAIDCATVEGWNVVIKKGEFQVGDACVYFEIDSFLPLTDARYDFLAKNKITWGGKDGIRLRTIKLRGQLSQGLILPLAQFPEVTALLDSAAGLARDMDFTATLGIEKWEAPIPSDLAGEVEGPFPAFIRKTDQERIQNVREVLTDCADMVFEVTVKLDGSSMTVFYRDGVTGVCGRNWWLRESAANSLWRIAIRDRLTDALKAYGRNLALQGEIIGEGIQGNPEKLQGHAFYLFDIFDIDHGCYLGRAERTEAVQALARLGAHLPETPLVDVITLQRFGGEMATILDYAEGPSLNPDILREGVVFKRLDGGNSFKVISNSYLLKHGDR